MVLAGIKGILSDALSARRPRRSKNTFHQAQGGLDALLVEGQDAAIGGMEERIRMVFRQRPDEYEVERLAVRLLTRVVRKTYTGNVMANVAVVCMNPNILIALADRIGRITQRVARSVAHAAIENQTKLVGPVEVIATESHKLDIHKLDVKALVIPGTQDAWNSYDQGVPMIARIFLLDGERAGQSYPLSTISRYKVRLGCGPYCDLRVPIDRWLVSADHAEIEAHGSGRFTLCDVGSTNGTCRNDELLVPEVPIWLRHGDIINLAGYRMQIVNPTLGGLCY